MRGHEGYTSGKDRSFRVPLYTGPLLKDDDQFDGRHTIVVLFEKPTHREKHEKGTTYSFDPTTADLTVEHTFGENDGFLQGRHNVEKNISTIEGGFTSGRLGFEAVVVWDHQANKIQGELKILHKQANVGIGHTIDIFPRPQEPLQAAA